MTQRLTNLRKLLESENLESILISSAPTIHYLTGYAGFSELEREAYVLVTKSHASIITDGRYITAVKNLSGFASIERSIDMPTSRIISNLIEKEKIHQIGFEPQSLTVAEYTEFKKVKATLVPFSLRGLRIKKDQQEIESIQEASKIALLSLQKSKKYLIPGITELEMVQRLELQMKKLRVNPSFPTIVAFGKNAAIPHHHSDATKLRKNDVVLIDFGVNYNGYCSDTTRTFFIGNVPEEWQKIYSMVKESQQKAADFIEEKLKDTKEILAADVDRVARDYILSKGYPTIPHSLGHGIGLNVHEAPTLSPTSKVELSEGMVFSIEPGIYLPGVVGVRIEDLFTIHDQNLVKLT